jgi:hypothetical protein
MPLNLQDVVRTCVVVPQKKNAVRPQGDGRRLVIKLPKAMYKGRDERKAMYKVGIADLVKLLKTMSDLVGDQVRKLIGIKTACII